MKQFFKELFKDMMKAPDVNSRFIFLVHGMVTCLALIALTVGFLCAKDRTGYPSMVYAVVGGGLGAAVGRYFTKKGGADDPGVVEDEPIDPQAG